MSETDASVTQPDVASLHHVCRELAEAADAVRDAARYASRIALGPRLPLVAAGPRRARAAQRDLLRTLTDPRGLGWAPQGNTPLAGALWLAGVLTSRESLAVSLAVTGLKARIRAAAVRHPELLDNPTTSRVLRAIDEDRQAEAVRVFRGLLTEKGAEYALALLAPSFTDIMAWNALTDENPFNDTAGWQIATGRPLTSDYFAGVSTTVWAFLNRGRGRAEPHSPSPGLLGSIDTSGTIVGYVRNIDRIGTRGLLLVQQVAGPDGVRRYVVQLAGMGPTFNQESPQDLLGGIDALGSIDTTYTRAVVRALRRLVPSGSQIALVGHSQGGITAMNLAASRDFNALYTVTHVVAIGSPIDQKRAADPRTRVLSLVNEHDIVPSLEGRSAVSPYELPPEFTEFSWTDDTQAFPLCHAAERYAHNLEHDVPHARSHVDSELAAFRGRVTGTHLFSLHDR
ncbi:alpha/beta fold hydrolase [Streptomyces sp. NBC_00091]|uniref:alpha/beta fold hydrolase n=1 Tax=Streptomyces sp. NBC_00091 TaxID=2975648 RepID=UPI00225A68BF|nr:alpha/beta fold hydrolase [Streptomyces sp. NBC_00091]MCX5381565.1 alpha/beta fold hydrolase [Streptomyces sp. NBC_00091]